MNRLNLTKIPKSSEIRCVYFQFSFCGGYSLCGIGLDGYRVDFWKHDYSTTIYDDELYGVLSYLIQNKHKISEYSIFKTDYEKLGGEVATI